MTKVDDGEVIAHLLLHMPLPEAARWLTSPNEELNGATPEETIEAGHKDDVLRLIAGLRSGEHGTKRYRRSSDPPRQCGKS